MIPPGLDTDDINLGKLNQTSFYIWKRKEK